VRGKEASKAWIANRATELLKCTLELGAKKLQVELERQFPIKMSYNKVWEGRQLALKGLHGTWDESFRMLWSFKAELEGTCPGSIVEIDCKKNKKDGQVYFCRMFVAIKACVNGFLAGCTLLNSLLKCHQQLLVIQGKLTSSHFHCNMIFY